jgi:hypothetical protein
MMRRLRRVFSAAARSPKPDDGSILTEDGSWAGGEIPADRPAWHLLVA